MAMLSPEETRPTPGSIYKRLAWLLACVGVGAVIGLAGIALTGNAFWYVAIPAVLAVGWLFLADPSQCDPSLGCNRRVPPGKHPAP